MWSRAARLPQSADAPDAEVSPRDVAVIDVGSNSVRLVIYRLDGRAIWSLFNEKVLAGLGRGVDRTGRLDAAGVETAMISLRRFKAVLDAVRPAAVFATATAAVREAGDGPAFVERVRAEAGLNLEVLSGAQEARLAALGVIAGAPQVDGVVGDLGGFSLELVQVHDREPGAGLTLPLGPFALGGAAAFDAAAVRREARRQLGQVAPSFHARTFYAVGGAWRNLAILHMRMADYPLEIVHQYEISAQDALDAARFIARQSRSSLDRIDGVSKKRTETLPHAAVVLEALIEELGVQRLSFSAYGLREGLLFDAMSDDMRRRDPLIEGCAALGARQEIAEDLGSALERWLGPALAALPPLFASGRDATLRAAACRLADLGSRLHPDHRAQLVFEQVLRAPIAGMDHAERDFLATAVFARHTAAPNIPEPRIIGRLLSPERLQRARALGSAIRLGCDLSGRSAVLLAASALTLEPGRVVLTARQDSADVLLGEQTARRGQTLAGLLGRELRMATR